MNQTEGADNRFNSVTMNLLVISSNEEISVLCRNVFEKLEHRVMTVSDMDIGFGRVEEFLPDLLLVHLQNPRAGWATDLATLTTARPDMIVIAMAEKPVVPLVVEAVGSGANDFLLIPFTADELMSSVEKAIQKQRSVSEAERLQRENRRMKEEFVSMVSHELRSPVATVLQYFEVLLGGVAGEILPEQRKILERMRDRMRELLAVIRDWLDVAQLDAGRLVRRFKDLDVVPLISETLNFMSQDIMARHLALTVDLPDALPVIRGDARTLKLVITNLVGNAVKYNKEGGQITVAAYPEDSVVRIEVSDTGIGISEEDLPFIFDEFFRAKTIEVEGTGLGLPITKKIVEAHSGSVTATSVFGEGSTFVVSLPIASA